MQHLGSYSRTPIKGGELSQRGGEGGNQSTNNQSIKSTSSIDNLLQHFLTFQLAFISFNILFSSSSQVSFNSSTHFSNLFSSSSQVSFNSL